MWGALGDDVTCRDFWLLDPTGTGPEGEWAVYEFAPKHGVPQRCPDFSALFQHGYEEMTEDS